MSDPISYPSLRIILEYLDANIRIHIASRSPTLQRFEKSIPLRLDHLFLSRRTIVINEVTHDIWRKGDCNLEEDESEEDGEEFETLPDKSELAPGDVLITSESLLQTLKWNSEGFRKITMKNGKVLSKTQIPTSVKEHTAIKTMMCSLMGGRKDIRVNRLSLFMCGFGVLRLPVNFRVQVQSLELPHDCYRDGFLDIVNPSSFPLKYLKSLIVKEDDFNHEIIDTTNQLTLVYPAEDVDTWFLPNFAKLTQQNISLHLMSRYGDEQRLLRIVQHYLKIERCIESKLTINWVAGFCKGDLNVVKNHYEGKSVKIEKPLKKAVEQFKFETEFKTSVMASVVPVTTFYSEIRFEIIPEIS